LAVAPVADAASARYVSPSLRGLVRAIGGDPAQAGSARYAYLNKLDSHIQELAAGRSQRAARPGGPTLGGVTVIAGDRALVDVYVNGDVQAAAQRLRALGMRVTATSTRAPERMVEGYMPVSGATDVAKLQSTRAVVSILGAGTDVGSVTSEGDAAHHGPQARALGPTGPGVKVGVMSDSINNVGLGIAGSQSTGDLPATVTDLGDAPTGEDEGRAMAEIIYDEAPGITNMVFDTGGTGAATKAAHIAALVSSGARVIADDTFYLSEPFFQDGIVSQAVDQAVADGTAYVASAGNRARQSWEGTFTPGPANLNDFGGGDTRQAVADMPAHRAVTLVLQWNEPFAAATDAFSINVRLDNSLIGTVSPAAGIAEVGFNFSTGATGGELEIEIHRTAGTGTPALKYIVANNFGTFSIKEHNTFSPAINPDAASARGSLAIAAECWSTVQSDCPLGPAGLHAPEQFSSRGPVTRLRVPSGNLLGTPDVRQKPNLAGADAVDTSVPGFAPFFGTSAATPSVAGVATLALSARPSLTVPQLYAILTDPRDAIPCTIADPIDACGVGFSQADKVVVAALDTTPPAVAAAPSPAAPNGAHGWYTTPVGVSWSVVDSESPVLSTTGCGPAFIASSTHATLTCTATSIGGTTTSPFAIKVDLTPPSAPTITGISAKRYKQSKLPAAGKIHCRAVDPDSGVDTCTVSGYSKRPGKHTLTAAATNDAGLTSKSKLTFRVTAVCKVPKLKGKSLRKAKRALKHAHCALGKTNPRHPSRGQKVSGSSPKAGAVKRAGTKVKLRFS
jgi:hypothetical protein